MTTAMESTVDNYREGLAREFGEALDDLQENGCDGVSVSLIQRFEAVEDALAELAPTDTKLALEFEGFRDELEELFYSQDAVDEVILRGQRIASILQAPQEVNDSPEIDPHGASAS